MNTKYLKYFLVFFAFALIFVFWIQPISAAVCDITPGITCAQVCGDISPGTPACAVGGVADGTCPATYTCIARPLCSAPGGPVLSFCSYNGGGTGGPFYQCVGGQCVPSSTGSTATQCQASCGSGGPCGVYHWNPWPSDCQPGTTVPGTQTRYGEDDCGNQIPQTRNCGCVAPKEDKNGICCDPNQVNYNGVCCTKNCTNKQCSDSNGCGGTCSEGVKPFKPGIVDIVIDPDYALQTKNERFFTPTMEELNPYDDIDCIYAPSGIGDLSQEGELEGTLYVIDSTGAKNILNTGRLTYDPTSLGWYVWKINGGTGLSGGEYAWGKTIIDKIDEPGKKKIFCEVKKKCFDGTSKSQNYAVSSCVHTWGGELAQRDSNANVYKLSFAGGIGVDKQTIKRYSEVYRDFINNGNLDPYHSYKNQFEYYTNLKTIDDSAISSNPGPLGGPIQGWVSIGSAGECKGIDLSIIETQKLNDKRAYYYDPTRSIIINSWVEKLLAHEVSHYFGVSDEYVYSSALMGLVNSFLGGKNCDIRSSCSNFQSITGGESFVGRCFNGCGFIGFYRSTQNSLMRYTNPVLLNAISCGIVTSEIKNTNFLDAYRLCKSMNVVQ